MIRDPEYNFNVDIERPNQEEIERISLEEAEDRFGLDHIDSLKLKQGKVVFVGEIAISRTEDSRTEEEKENKKENE